MTSVRKAINEIIFYEELGYDPSLFDNLVRLVKLVAKGTRRSLFVYGGAGTGKTFTVTNTLNSLGLQQNKDWYIFSGKTTVLALYKQLFLLRKGKILVFDDFDESWNNPDAAALLKAALDTQARTLNWLSSRTTNVTTLSAQAKEDYNRRIEAQLAENPENPSIKFPSEFLFTSRVIFISNQTEQNMDKAVLSRVLKIDMTLNVPQVFKRMAALIHQGQLGPKNMSEREKIEVLNTLIRLYNAKKLTQPSLRTFVAAAELKDKGEEDWISLLKYT